MFEITAGQANIAICPTENEKRWTFCPLVSLWLFLLYLSLFSSKFKWNAKNMAFEFSSFRVEKEPAKFTHSTFTHRFPWQLITHAASVPSSHRFLFVYMPALLTACIHPLAHTSGLCSARNLSLSCSRVIPCPNQGIFFYIQYTRLCIISPILRQWCLCVSHLLTERRRGDKSRKTYRRICLQ